ncbi:MAG: hypothetical protein M1817_001760 [Caeruleum heppii]|nr:MAG: hypothetical protein M1817_001760 [Caeruleum heppii]
MVAFSCENCNDVLPKKKLDAHRGYCHGASFSCLDCSTHFRGTDYRNHTSCISEAQKYEGHLYRPKDDNKNKSRPAHALAAQPRKAYVEDAPDADNDRLIGIVNPPPPAPSPPSAKTPHQQPSAPVNVFDYLVNEDTPNGSRTALAPPPATESSHQITIVEASPPFHRITNGNTNASKETFGESRYNETGFHYGEGPVPVIQSATQAAYLTPAPRHERERDRNRRRDSEDAIRRDRDRDHKKDKKRKRVHIDDLDLTAARSSRQNGGYSESDQMMVDAPPAPELHTGLTGGLNRLLSRPSDYPPSPDYSGGDGVASPGSPLKRSKHAGRGRTPENGSNGMTTALVRTRKVSGTVANADDSTRPRDKHHRKHKHRHSTPSGDEAARPSRKLRAIEYPDPSSERAKEGQLVLHRTRAELFSSFITKGPGSEKGCSINKALKRYHRERGHILGVGDKGMGRSERTEEEKMLWKGLRVRRNEAGEMVLFF